MNLNQLAGGTANYLSQELALDTGKIDNLRFGLEIIFGALIMSGKIRFVRVELQSPPVKI